MVHAFDPSGRGPRPLRLLPLILAAFFALSSSPARAEDASEDEGATEEKASSGAGIQLSPPSVRGYLQPRVELTYRPEARAEDRWTYGVANSQVGLVLLGSLSSRWHYVTHVVVSADAFDTVTDVEFFDSDGDGTPDSVETERRPLPGLFLEEASIAFDASEWLRLKLGQMRIPFTVQHQSPNSELLFPNRSGPNQAFLSGTDGGLLALFSTPDRVLQGSAGVFGGSEVPVFVEETRESGPLFSLRLDYAPLGWFPYDEAVVTPGPLRVGLGAGLLYHPGVVFDEEGFIDSTVTDLRMSASVRVAGRGMAFQAEVLRRHRTDNLLSQPTVDTGAYAQGSALVLSTDDVAVAPIARFGWTGENQQIDTRTTLFVEGGLAFYFKVVPQQPDALKLVAQYVGEFRRTENEDAHGGVIQAQLRF